jgi:glycosyltransferase involved in cell wall biosynthesis
MGEKMKILILHNKYIQSGGEDAVVEEEARMLINSGHEVFVHYADNKKIKGFFQKLATLLSTKYNELSYKNLKNLINEIRPDIIHIHNFWPILSPSVHKAANDNDIAVVQTLHNYRLICAGAQFLRKQKVCEKCLKTNRLWAFFHKCYRNSYLGSYAVIRMQIASNKVFINDGCVQQFIALTNFSAKKFIESGMPRNLISVKPNTIKYSPSDADYIREGILFVGRISIEKGVDVILKAASLCLGLTFKIIGDGPDLAEIKRKAPKNIIFLGHCDNETVKKHMLSSKILVMPSLWYEGFPVTLLESYSCSLPVIASDIGSLGELIINGKTGYLFPMGDPKSLATLILELCDNDKLLHEMGVNALNEIKTKYSIEKNLQLLLSIYKSAIKRRKDIPLRCIQ